MGKNNTTSGTARNFLHLEHPFWMKIRDALHIHWPVIPIVLLGAFLRLYRISEYLTFLGDEGRDVLVVKRMIVDGKLTLLGPTSSVGGFFLGPVYYYFMAPFLWLWKLDPTGPAVMVALFGIATIFLVYYTGREFFSRQVGLIAALLYALSPIVIAYSRSSWNPNLVPFFSLILILLLSRVIDNPDAKKLLLIGITLGIGLQLHYVFLFMFIVCGVWFLIVGKRSQYLRYIFLVSTGFLIGYSPFLLFELRHGFPNTITIFNFLREGDETGFGPVTFVTNIVDVTYRLFARIVLRVPQPELWSQFPMWQQKGWIIGTWVAVLGSLVTLIYTWRKKKSRSALLLVVWFTCIITLFGFYKRGIYEYYFGIFFPFPFISLSLAFSYLLKKPKVKLAALCILIGLVYSNWEGRPFKHPPNNQLAQTKRIAQTAFEKTEGKPFNFALVTATNSDHAFRYFFEIWGRPPVTIENPIVDPERKTVTDQLIVICEDPKCQPLGHPLWEIAGFGRADITGSWEVPFVKIYKLVRVKE